MINWLKSLAFTTVVAIMSGCANRQAVPSINCKLADATYPLELSKLDILAAENFVHLSDEITGRIEQTVREYYTNECAVNGDTVAFSVNDILIRTLRLRDSSHSVFLLLLRHIPTGAVNGKLLFYNNNERRFINDVAIDFNLHALYCYEDGQLKPTNLEDELKLEMPELQLVDVDSDGINEFELKRLYHNGTANAIETTVLKIGKQRIDTLAFTQEWI